MRSPTALFLAGAILLLGNLSAAPASFTLTPSTVHAPAPLREFRGAWVASVANIDWPSKPGLSTEQQQTELLAILDRAKTLNLNTIVLQVRPACDALYDSKLEPWSEYITGRMGEPPFPYYDPLAFAVEEAHKRGLELHAWFNPYRARQSEAKSPISDAHISRQRPDMVRAYGKSLWLDPSEKDVQDYSLGVILDVVKRYDIDGVHIDDYFYPYKEKGSDGRLLDFPDDAGWQKYHQARGKLARDDWRRDSVNKFIERLYKAVKHEKSWVKVGISPFGIWRPGNPAQIKGFDAYQEIYADSKLWLNEGWLDYWSPQLYWKSDQQAQSYPALLEWWVSQNKKDRHIWPGNYTSRVNDGGSGAWSPTEIVRQIDLTRAQPGAGGNIHFSMKSLMPKNKGLGDALLAKVYAQPALVPASPWLQKESFAKPKVQIEKDPDTGDSLLAWSQSGRGKVWLWTVQIQDNPQNSALWQTIILPGTAGGVQLSDIVRSNHPVQVALTPVDRCSNLGPTTIVEITGEGLEDAPPSSLRLAPRVVRPVDPPKKANDPAPPDFPQ